jgi:drug/metabolite transporter (DMT)-like permease
VTLLLVLRVFDVEATTLRVVQSVLIIAIGTLLTTLSVPALSIPGILYLLGAEIAEALRLVLTQNLLVNCDFSVLEGQYFLAPVASVSLLTLAAIIELPHAFASSSASSDHDASISKIDGTIGNVIEGRSPLEAVASAPHLFLTACVLGVLVNYLGYLVILEVGALTLKVLGTVRNIGLVTYGALCLGEELTPMECAGYAISLTGFVAYTHFKSQGGQAQEIQATLVAKKSGGSSPRVTEAARKHEHEALLERAALFSEYVG